MKCNLQIDKNGELKVGGVNAPLFREAMLRTNQNEEASLKIWAVAESEGFKEFNVPPTYDNVIKYNEYRERIDSTPFSSTELSDSMNASIGNVFFQEDFMKSFTNEKGEFEINSDRLKKVGLYSSSEIYNLLSDEKVQRNVKKFYNKSLNFEAPITTSEAKYVVKSDNEISSLGFFKRENPDVVSETLGNIFSGVKNKEDFDNRKMKVDEQWEAVKYEDISSDFSDKTSIAQYVENPLTNELELKSYNNTYYETLFGTEIGENNEKAVEIIDLITSLTPEQLSDTNEIKHAFNTLSKELVKSGIDFVGIENQYGEIPSPKIMELLFHTKNILINEAISEEGLQNYVDVYNKVFEKNQNTKKSLFDGIITNSVKIEKENISDASLFINNSLVKIKENVYKKINRSYEDVYEAVYNLMKNGGKQVIPFDVSKAERSLYKEKVIKELREFASKKSQGIRNDVEATNEEIHEMALLTEYFKEGEQIVNPKIEWVKFERLSKIKDVESWKSRFIQKMNKEMISQKMKGNQLPLTITQRGVEMTTDGDYSLSLIKNSIPNALYSDLIDYGFLTNQDFLATEEGIFIDEGNVDFQRNLYSNNPNLISEYNGVVEYGQGTDLKAVGDTFIKVRGIVYEKVNGNVYGLVSNQGEQTWNRQIPKVSTKPSENKVLGKKTIKQTTNFNVNVEERNPNTNEIENVEVEISVPSETTNDKALSEGVNEVQRIAEEYKIANDIVGVQHSKVTKLFPNVSKMISEAYEQTDEYSDSKEVTESYKALEEDTIKQYEFIVSKGLSVSRWKGSGEPYPNSKSMLKDVRENNHLYFLPNSEAFGKEEDSTEERLGLKPTDIYLDDGYRMTLSEVFRVVHDYFGHGILGNQFGAVGEENATLQHLDLYSEKALPAVVFQTRGQNSWVNFSRVNDEALRKMKEGRETSNEELLKQGQDEFKFATPKDNILPKIFNFKTYETARRINEQEEIRKSETYLDPRGKYEDSFISDSLSRYTENSSGKLNGFSRRSLGVSKRLGRYDVDVIAEYEGNKEVERLIKNVFPQFKGTQKIYEISNGDVYREMMIEALETNKFKSSVTVHSTEDFSNMRLFVTEDGSTGITLTKDGFLGGAFGNPKADRPNNLAQMMLLGIKEGAITAEAFDTVLPNYYSMFGLKAVSRTAFNEEYRPLKVNGALEDWDYDTYYKFNKGKPDVVFFIYDGGSRETIQERIGQFDSYSRYQKDFTESYDKESYDEAYRFMEVEAVNKSLYETPTIVETTKESEIFKTLSSIPLLNEDEALKAYKNIYSNKMFDWKNQEC